MRHDPYYRDISRLERLLWAIYSKSDHPQSQSPFLFHKLGINFIFKIHFLDLVVLPLSLNVCAFIFGSCDLSLSLKLLWIIIFIIVFYFFLKKEVTCVLTLQWAEFQLATQLVPLLSPKILPNPRNCLIMSPWYEGHMSRLGETILYLRVS